MREEGDWREGISSSFGLHSSSFAPFVRSESDMKAVCFISGVLILILMTGCTKQTQLAQTNQQNAQSNTAASAQPHSQPSAAATGRGTPDEAKAMLQQAVAHYNS